MITNLPIISIGKGFTMYRKSKMVEICLGLTIVMVGFGVMGFLILKAYAPNGFIH